MPYVADPLNNQLFLGVHPLLRILGDLMTILASFVLAYLNKAVPEPTFEPFAKFSVYTIVTYLNLVTFGYFYYRQFCNGLLCVNYVRYRIDD
jgi:hypothetical protein